jgi:DNA (cytosine-5)-methyltransferase 1
MNEKLRVVDFFCGAGGFSEGFRQMGFEIIMGYDHWKPAVDTYNHNFNLNCEPKNILDFKNSIDEINDVPDTEVILGSPPCVSFSSSNRSGKADKSLGLELTECFLRIVAVKKHQPNSILKAWFMENVVNSKRYLQTSYTFKDLDLAEWALSHRISPYKIAIDLLENSTIINAADYGAIQARKRAISGEFIKKRKLIVPEPTHSKKNPRSTYNSIRKLKDNFPTPFEARSAKMIKDVQYPIEIPQNEITDHFYDTGIYKAEWKFSRHWKLNHPFMGRMSFPENLDGPSRTITATKIANSRESIIYKCEIERNGDGEYRLPTVREAAIIMGFPITYQFIGSEGTKWRLVGNAVCCSVSRSLAAQVLKESGLKMSKNLILESSARITGLNNLNDYNLKVFNSPPVKKKGSRFRRQPIKDGNMTVTLSNYDIQSNHKDTKGWLCSIQYGTGKGFPIQNIPDGYHDLIENIVTKANRGVHFIQRFDSEILPRVGSSQELQSMYELQTSFNGLLEPTDLVESISTLLNDLQIEGEDFDQDDLSVFHNKKTVPLKQLFALYAISKVATLINKQEHAYSLH